MTAIPDLLSISMDWFIYDKDLRQERVDLYHNTTTPVSITVSTRRTTQIPGSYQVFRQSLKNLNLVLLKI